MFSFRIYFGAHFGHPVFTVCFDFQVRKGSYPLFLMGIIALLAIHLLFI